MPTLEWIEREAILAEYRMQGQNKTRTAQVLGISINTLSAKLEKYEAEKDPIGTPPGQKFPEYRGELAEVAVSKPVQATSEESVRPAESNKKRYNR